MILETSKFSYFKASLVVKSHLLFCPEEMTQSELTTEFVNEVNYGVKIILENFEALGGHIYMYQIYHNLNIGESIITSTKEAHNSHSWSHNSELWVTRYFVTKYM